MKREYTTKDFGPWKGLGTFVAACFIGLGYPVLWSIGKIVQVVTWAIDRACTQMQHEFDRRV